MGTVAAGVFAGTNVDDLLVLTVRGLIGAARRTDGDEAPVVATGALAVAGVTIAVFAVLVAAWRAAASWLGSHRRVIAVVERYGHRLVPLVFVTIGVVILASLA